MKRNPAEKESDIQKTIIEYLELRRIFFYRNNTGGFLKAGHFYRFGTLGSPDIVCVINGQYVGLEIKDAKGEQSRLQTNFEHELTKAGGRYYICRSLQDAMDALK